MVGDTAQWLRALDALSEEEIWFPAPTWCLTAKRLTQVPGEPMPSSGFLGHQTHITVWRYSHINKSES